MEVAKVTCPYCGNVHGNYQDFIDIESEEAVFELDCEACGKWFNVYMEYLPRFKATKMED